MGTPPPVVPSPAAQAGGPDPGPRIRERLEVSRRDLLDFSLRNPLLNYRPSKARGVEFTGASAAELFPAFVREGRTFRFAAASEPAATTAPPDAPVARIPGVLQTTAPEPLLQSRLLATYYAARTHLEERGANILFLALGMLYWIDEQNDDKPLKAPLLLVPAALERSSARERFTLRYREEDVEENLSLSAKLKAAFALDLPSLPDTDDLDVMAYVRAVANAVNSRPRWSVAPDEIVLGFFAFGKFLMYRDLDPDAWPGDARPEHHPLLRAILLDGFRETPSTLSEASRLDPHQPPDRITHVVDADSSQVLALLDARNGSNLVIQGPPGTGKSQTITNLIADAVHDGKKVLFVAEKMAALDVVKRRLDAVGLGDACLELHSHNTHKKNLLAELRRTLELGKPRTSDLSRPLALYGELRNRLNAYAEAMNAPVGESGHSPHRIIGELLKLLEALEGASPPRLPDAPEHFHSLAAWSQSEYQRREQGIKDLEALLAVMGSPDRHPFRHSRLEMVLPSDLETIRTALLSARQSLATLRDALQAVSDLTALPIPPRTAGVAAFRGAVKVSLAAPPWAGMRLQDEAWRLKRTELAALMAAGAEFTALHARWDSILIPEAWGQDVLDLRQALQVYGAKWWRLASGAYREAVRRLAGLCRGALPGRPGERFALVEAILEAGRCRKIFQDHDALAAALFGPLWRKEQSDWAMLDRLHVWITGLHRDIEQGILPGGFLDFLARQPDLLAVGEKIRAIETAQETHSGDLRRALDLLRFDDDARRPLTEESVYTDRDTALAELETRLPDLPDQAAFNTLTAALRKDNLGWFLDVSRPWTGAGRLLRALFSRAWLEALLRRAFTERRPLAEFNSLMHEKAIADFRALDQLLLKHNRARIAEKHWERLPKLHEVGQLGVLKREFEKKSRHLPIRRLLADSGAAVQAVKPVFMMSPLSAAAYLAPGSVRFDLVVFDEASQVRPVDAFGAILRGKQVVVVGDSRQLPPTAFFENFLDETRLDENGESVTADLESILGLVNSRGAAQRMLRWHYRSRHESLIAVSNREFYDNRLVIFPSPCSARGELGLTFHYLPGTQYQRGTTRSNPGEADAVARAVLDHAARNPALTLGVAAFSIPQMLEILTRLEALRRDNPAAEPFFSAHPEEPFFVKNLETVQGDERDVIFISVGYGRDADGKLTLNFGALNAAGGDRRLNVLITRARRRCEVFSGLTHEDIDLRRVTGRGVEALKTFLRYAQTGRLDTTPPAAPEGTPLVAAVETALNKTGHAVVRRAETGEAGLSLAIADPMNPDRCRLGIEDDGPAYDRPRTARDRDRLRPQVLEQLGWKLFRVWSKDWFLNADRVLKNIGIALQPAADPPTPPPSPAVTLSMPVDPPARDLAPRPAAADGLSAPPYEMHRFSRKPLAANLADTPPEKIGEWLAAVVKKESPVHKEEAFRRIADAAGVERMGQRIQVALEKAIVMAGYFHGIRPQGDFLWAADSAEPVIRDRRSLPPASRKLDFVASEEIALAIRQVVKSAFGIRADELPNAVCRRLGFDRVTEEMRLRLRDIAGDLLRSGTLKDDNGILRLRD